MDKLTRYAYTINHFCTSLPHEKIYLHFDNTSYYKGDNIWFKCYLISNGLRPTELSKTLYVELLNPGGEIIDKQVLRVENGQCHGGFVLNRLPFYSGFYEIRAYTKYILNFGEEAIFSRVMPVFDKPKKEVDFSEKNMQRHGYGKYPRKREKLQKGKKINLKFYPEGGNLIEGVPSMVAFEATDTWGNPLDIKGTIVNEMKEETHHFYVTHEGRGIFSYTPSGKNHTILVNHEGKKYSFELPKALPEGFALKVDNLSYSDSIGISVQKNQNTPAEILGMALFNDGKIRHFSMIDVSGNEVIQFKVDKTKLSSGVSRIIMFNSNGHIISDRLLFINNMKLLEIKTKVEKDSYDPYDLVELEFSIINDKGKGVQTPFSVSVRDATDEVESEHNILTNLLLMSEIKGYVRNPSYYFKANTPSHCEALDLLMMVQGWRRYTWQQMVGLEPFELKYMPEKGIETQGQVVSMVRKKPKPDVDVSLFLTHRGENEDATSFVEALKTDSLSKFTFVSDIFGKWNLILAVSEKGKKKDHRIILDRTFTRAPKRYTYTDLQVNLASPESMETVEDEKKEIQEDINDFLTAYEDSLSKAGIDEKIHRLDEVTVTAKKRTKERDIYESRSKSIAYYDVSSEIDDITDRGEFIGKDIHALMLNMNDNFRYTPPGDYLQYKGKLPLFVINYERTMHTEMDYNKYKLIRLEAIKSIYISEDFQTICKYADPRFSPMNIDDVYRCVVLIETHPDGMIPTDAGKGVRKTWLEGYSQISEFYSPDYSVLPPEPDYRRTLYWNPSVIPDKNGKAFLQFYNNSRSRKFKISAETVSAHGLIGMCF